jgi:hypothetical protein
VTNAIQCPPVAPSEIHLIPGPGGWVQARFGDTRKRRRLWVRFEPTPEGPWKAAEWSVPDYPDAEMRQIPFHRIRKAVGADGRVLEELAARLSEPAEEGFRHAFGEPVRGKPIQITRPKSRRLDDEFYARVADAYRQAVGRGLNPRQAIAEAAGVSPDVAGRWIYQARRRDLIPKTSAGRVTV